MNSEILARFYAAGGERVEMSSLSRELEMSEANLRKRITGLREIGFDFEEHPQWGFRLVRSPDHLIADDLKGQLYADRIKRQIGSKILVLEKTSSTHDVTQRFALEGYKAGLVVFAEEQTAGRGRHGRTWISPPRKGVWCTVLLRPNLPPESASRLTVMAAVATAEALRRCTNLPLRIKWPNDILCQGRKVAGILVELSVENGRMDFAMVGIGVDVNLEPSDFPPELRVAATSLRTEAGHEFHRPTLACELLRSLEATGQCLGDESFEGLLDRWVELDETLGRQIVLTKPDGSRLRGLASNLDTDGALVIRKDDGRMERILAGEVTLEKECA